MDFNIFLGIEKAWSKWSEIVTQKSITSTQTIDVLTTVKLFLIFGIPNILVTDYGRQFASHDIQQFLKHNGIRLKRSAPFHQMKNGKRRR